MTDDLVNRLRADELPDDRQIQREARIELSGILNEAANRIEELEKYASIHAKCDQTNLEVGLRNFAKLKDAQDRIEELEKQLSASNRHIMDLEEKIEELEYEIYELGTRND
jgi:chromosome segregation ATPase